MAPDLVAQLAGVAGARDHQRDTVEIAQPGDGEAEPAELLQVRLGRRGPDQLFEDFAALGALHRDVVQLVGRGLDPDLEAQLLGLLAQPDAAVVVATDPAEVVGPEAEGRAVVDHAAVLVAHGRVDHLSDRKAPHVAGQTVLHQRLGVGADHLELAQRREVNRHGPLAAGPVFLDGAIVREAVGQPEAAVFGEVAGQRGGAWMERGLARQLGFGVGSHAISHRFGEGVLGRVDPDVDLGRVPAVGRVDVAGTGRGGADQVSHGTQQHIVAGPRPGLVQVDPQAVIQQGVVEEVDRRPAAAGFYRRGSQHFVEVVGAVDVARIAHVLVILGGAG